MQANNNHYHNSRNPLPELSSMKLSSEYRFLDRKQCEDNKKIDFITFFFFSETLLTSRGTYIVHLSAFIIWTLVRTFICESVCVFIQIIKIKKYLLA